MKTNLYIKKNPFFTMIIKNFSELGTTQERKDALEIVNAGIEAVLTKNAIQKYVKLNENILTIKDQTFDLNNFERVFVIGGGKAAADMAEEIEGNTWRYH